MNRSLLQAVATVLSQHARETLFTSLEINEAALTKVTEALEDADDDDDRDLHLTMMRALMDRSTALIIESHRHTLAVALLTAMLQHEWSTK